MIYSGVNNFKNNKVEVTCTIPSYAAICPICGKRLLIDISIDELNERVRYSCQCGFRCPLYYKNRLSKSFYKE